MSVEKNIQRLYIYRIFQSSMMFIPIYILFLIENGLSITQALFLVGYFAFMTVLLEVPSGVFADKFGRKNAIFFSSLFVFLGTLLFAVGKDFIVFLAAETIFSFSMALWSGTDSAFIYDTLKVLNRKKEFRRIYGNMGFITFTMFGISGLIGSYFADINLRLVMWVSLIPLGIAVFIPLTFTEPRFSKKVEFKYWGHIKEAFTYAASHKQIRFFILFFMVIFGVSEGLWLLNQPYFAFVGLQVKFFGFVYFFIFITTAIASKFAYKIEHKLGIKNTMYFMTMILLIVYFLMGYFPAILMVFLPVLSSFVFGMQFPIIDGYINKNVESHHRATMISLKNLSGKLMFSMLAPLLGWIADIWSITTAFLLSSFILLIDLMVLFYIFQIKKSEVLK
ncbi:MAG: MFS transporter [Candidatus Woesearchaeota archaeon]|nr:MFS transporter [Candidatus Woesearchaeota archaeon]MDP7622912.1 MFS transporter [Candidatus Woesearchaeota archaeon]HJN56427.1 MFS transporter [Candidatus Woesearchaeota archaeon]